MKQPQQQPSEFTITLEPNDIKRLASLRGQFDENLRLIENRLKVDVRSRHNVFTIFGDEKKSQLTIKVLYDLYQATSDFRDVTPEEVHLHLRQFEGYSFMDQSQKPNKAITDIDNYSVIRTKKGTIKPRGLNQQRYVRSIQTHDVNFGVGPAGTGKTYLAVACAVEAFLRDEVERILLVRPAVEAGERLGFLPGDLAQKVDPYLRPLYDALHEMLGFDAVAKLQERNIIEVAPLAYMRGRTLNSAYIILDESQNTTREQMKMFLTRIGFGSTAVITGDMSQIDLPRGTSSGLVHACNVLKTVDEISFTHFESRDVVRHSIVQSIVDAYDLYESDN